MNSSHMHTNHSPLMKQSPTFWCPVSVNGSPPLFLFLSGWQKKRGRPLRGGGMLFRAAGPAGPILALGLCGLGHHQGAPVSCDFKLICTTALKASTCASRGAWKYSDINWRDAIYLLFHQANVLDFKDLIKSIVTKGLNETGTYSPRWVKADLVKEKLKKPETTWGLRVSLRFNLDSKCYTYDWLQTFFFFFNFGLPTASTCAEIKLKCKFFLFCKLPSVSLLPTRSRLCLLSSVTPPSPALVLSCLMSLWCPFCL